jgi:hypothetical protein
VTDKDAKPPFSTRPYTPPPGAGATGSGTPPPGASANAPQKKSKARGTIVRVGGAEMRLVELDAINERFAILDVIGKASVYVSRRDRMTIQENDLKRRLANEVVLVGMRQARDGETPGQTPVYEGAFKFWNRHAHRHVYSPSPTKTRQPTHSTYFAVSASRQSKDVAILSSAIFAM